MKTMMDRLQVEEDKLNRARRVTWRLWQNAFNILKTDWPLQTLLEGGKFNWAG